MLFYVVLDILSFFFSSCSSFSTALGLYSGGDIALSEKMLALKEQVIASCVTGCTLAVALKETSLVENAAVYLWNFHLHIFRDISGVKPSPLRFDKMLPSLTAALDSTLSALQAVSLFLFLFVCFCLFLFILALCIDLLADKVQPLSRWLQTTSLSSATSAKPWR
jgi:hypothetical protein